MWQLQGVRGFPTESGAFPQAGSLRCESIHCYSQEVATRAATKYRSELQLRVVYATLRKLKQRQWGFRWPVRPPQVRRTPSHFDQVRKRRS